MKTKDEIKKQDVGGSKFPNLHGHTKIILTNVKTGEIEEIEKDNLVTGAVATLLAQNNFGAKNYKELLPIKDLFGGVLCFEQELDEDATLVPAENENSLIAHAGQTSHSSVSTTRGNPNGVLSELIQDNKGFKFVWDFSTSQGNGTISALSLTHKWLGDYGLKPVEVIAGETLLLDNSNKAKEFRYGYDYPTFNECYTCLLSANRKLHAYLPSTSGNTKIIITEVDLNPNSYGITEDLAGVIDDKGTPILPAKAVHEITLTTTFLARYSAVCIDDTSGIIYVLTLGTSAGHTITINAINTRDWSVSAQTITESSMDLTFFDDHTNIARCINRIIVSDGYLYVPNSTKRSFYRVNLTNTADITLLESTLTEDINLDLLGMTEISEGLIYGANFIINGSKVYPHAFVESNLRSIWGTSPYQYPRACVRFVRFGEGWYSWAFLNNTDYPLGWYLGSGFPLGYLGTIQNLPQSVTKTNEKTMQIQYSITLDEE